MKRNLLLGLLALTALSTIDLSADCLDSCHCENTGKSYMAIRPLFQSASPELVSAFREDFPGMREEGYGSAFQAVIFGSKSTESSDFDRYFTPFCHGDCPSLIVDEQDSNFASGPMNLRATHFNIFTVNHDFRSRISLRPKRTEVGLGLAYRKDGFWRNVEKGRQFFFSINAPITHVKNRMELHEEVIQDGGGVDENATITGVAQPNMVAAFQQAAWEYGKIISGEGNCSSSNGCTESYSKTKLADIEAKIGIEWIDREPVHLESYLGILIPTGNKAESRLLFEPIVGWGKHVGIIFGSSAGIEVWRNEETDRVIRLETSCHTQYLFKNTQVRSFDLKGKPWSRYMQVYVNQAQAEEAAALAMAAVTTAQIEQATNLATPGINVFTFDVEVTPGFSNNITNALVLTCGSGFQGELGYNFYARRSECIKFSDKCKAWEPGAALKHETGGGLTNPVRDITGNFRLELPVVDVNTTALELILSDYANNQIQRSDIDLVTAAQPSALSHTVFGVLGYRWEEREYPTILSGGASYEFSHTTNAIMERWVLWAKVGVSF